VESLRSVPIPFPVPRVATPRRGRVAVFAPHPDDEVAGPGGTIALHRAAGDPVRAVVVTDGRAGNVDKKLALADYVALRRRESREAAEAIGGIDLTFFDYPDSHVITEEALADATARATAWLREAPLPDVAYAPWPGESHTDHAAVGEIARRALLAVGFRGTLFGFEVWSPGPADVVIDVSPVAEKKRAALHCHRSQLVHTPIDDAILGLNAWRALFLPKGGRFAEGFVTTDFSSAPR